MSLNAVADAFHRHLDGCQQCLNNPFGLCEEGHVLLGAAAIVGKRLLQRNAERLSMMKRRIMNSEHVARVCHEANRAYCLTIGDDSQPAWDEAPDWQKSSAIKGVEFHLNTLKSGQEPSPSASHESWLVEKREQGWNYGPVKDPEKKEHPCFVPYEELPIDQRMKDYIFAGIVKSFFNAEKSEFSTVA